MDSLTSQPVLNSIPQEQNAQTQIQRLEALRHLYSRAKIVLGVQLLLTLVLAMLLSALVAFFPGVKIWVVFYGLSVSILDAAVLDSIQKSAKAKAAQIHELFDCTVLQIDWHESKTGTKPDAETVYESAHRYQQKVGSSDSLRDWYPVVVGVAPLPFARLICQRLNLYWDANLRRRYNTWLATGIGLTSVIVCLIAFAGGMTLEDLVLVVLAPLSPALLWGIREYKRQSESIRTMENLKSYAESAYLSAIKDEPSPERNKQVCRDLQDAIFDLRRSSPLIFDWIYRRLRGTYEEQVGKGAEALVIEALQATQRT